MRVCEVTPVILHGVVSLEGVGMDAREGCSGRKGGGRYIHPDLACLSKKTKGWTGGRRRARGRRSRSAGAPTCPPREREFFIDNLLVRIHFIIVMLRWTGLAPWEFDRAAPVCRPDDQRGGVC